MALVAQHADPRLERERSEDGRCGELVRPVPAAVLQRPQESFVVWLIGHVGLAPNLALPHIGSRRRELKDVSERVVIRVREGEIVVTTREGLWQVRMGEREAEHRYLDHALAQLLGRSPGSVMELVREVLGARPEDERG